MNGRHNNYEKPLRGPKYLIRDRDKKYATRFSAVAFGSGIKEVKTPYRTPQANGICERFMGSLRRECIDHVLIHGDKHLEPIRKTLLREKQ
jgi:transposase InsO family protein